MVLKKDVLIRHKNDQGEVEVHYPITKAENIDGLDEKISERVADDGYISTKEKGAAGGVASLGTDGKVPAKQLPEMDYDPKGSAAGVEQKLDVHKGDKGNPHGVTAEQAGADLKGSAAAVQSNLNAHTGSKANPHEVTKAQVGLGNVDNTSDANKPVSTAQKAAIDAVGEKADRAQGTADEAKTAVVTAQSTANDAMGIISTTSASEKLIWFILGTLDENMTYRNNPVSQYLDIGFGKYDTSPKGMGKAIAEYAYACGCSKVEYPFINLVKCDTLSQINLNATARNELFDNYYTANLIFGSPFAKSIFSNRTIDLYNSGKMSKILDINNGFSESYTTTSGYEGEKRFTYGNSSINIFGESKPKSSGSGHQRCYISINTPRLWIENMTAQATFTYAEWVNYSGTYGIRFNNTGTQDFNNKGSGTITSSSTVDYFLTANGFLSIGIGAESGYASGAIRTVEATITKITLKI